MTLGGLLTVICVGWFVKKPAFMDEITSGGTVNVPRPLAEILFFVIKYAAPVVIIVTALSIIF